MKYIFGPCSCQSMELSLYTAHYLNNLMKDLGIKDWIWKGSYLKSNRTSKYGARGPGLKQGIEIFKELKKQIPNLKIWTDVHECCEIKELINIIDIVCIPAMLARQSFLIEECAKNFNIVAIKKMQMASPTQAAKWRDKIFDTNLHCEGWIVERGTAIPYDRLFTDFSGFAYLKKYYTKHIWDVSHSTQKSRDGFTGGDKELAKFYFKIAGMSQTDGIFAEVYPFKKTKEFGDPVSDGDSMLDIDDLAELIERQQLIQKASEVDLEHKHSMLFGE